MKKSVFILILLGCFLSSKAQKDSILFYKHTFGIDVLSVFQLIYAPPFGGASDINLDLFYRYQLNRKWGVNISGCYRLFERAGMGLYTIDKIDGNGFSFRLGPVYSTSRLNESNDAHFTLGVNAVVSFMNNDVYLTIPNSVWGNYKDNYSINRNRYGAELELALEESLSNKLGARVVIRTGYAPTKMDADGMKGEYFPGIYSWFNSTDTYFYATLFLFYRVGKMRME